MHRTLRSPLWLAAGLCLPVALLAQAPAGATAKCKDGSYSTATSTKGRCSGHGGVASLVTARKTSSRASTASHPAAKSTASSARRTSTKPRSSRPNSAAAPASKPAPAKPATGSTSSPQIPTARAPAGAPAGATAMCKDGTYSTSKVHTGACSHHGGVSEWLQ